MEYIEEKPSKEIKILHPFVFIIFEIINVYLTVNETASMEYIIRPILVLLILTFIIYRFLIIILKDKYKSGIIISASIIFIFSFFYFYQFINQTIRIPGIVFISIWTIIYAIIIFATLKFNKNLIKTNKFLNLISVIILLTTLSLTLFLEYKITNYDTSGIFKNKWINNVEKKYNNKKPNLPDIYYIILDSYARQDILNHIYGFNNQPFINYLKKKGFYVASKSQSNYNLTYFSLASSLNSDYINNLTHILGENSKRYRLPINLLQENRVVKFLKQKGYKTVTFDSILSGTYIKGANKIIGPFLCFSEFETIILKVSIFSILLNKTLYDSHYRFNNYTLNNLSNIYEVESPKFVFAHILSPHPPFVFGTNGKLRNLDYSYNIFDGYNFFSPTKTYKMYIDGYISQVKYINHKLKIIINKILSNSKIQPIIIIQGDHGPRSSFHSGDINKPDIRERMSILNAILLPENARQLLYNKISPVNTFRIIFNHLFNKKLPLLKDLYFFSSWTKLFKFNRVFL